MNDKALAEIGCALTEAKERILLEAIQRRLVMSSARIEHVLDRMVRQVDRLESYETYLLDRLPLVTFLPPSATGGISQVTATLRYQDYKEFD